MSVHREKRKNDEIKEEEEENNEMEAESNSESNDDEEDDKSSDSSSEESDEEFEQIDADFEAYPPANVDREGIKALLKQLFKKEPIELGQLVNYLIDEKSLCTVVKQLIDEEVVDEEDEDVFSLSSLLNLNLDKPFIKLINKFLLKTAKEHNCKQIIKLLDDQNENKYLVLNERFINLPPKVGIMSLQNLLDEAKNQNLKIDYFIFICKLLKAKDSSSSTSSSTVTTTTITSFKKDNNKRSKNLTTTTTQNDNKTTNELIYLNGEDELFTEHALEKYEFKIVDDNSDMSVKQNWKSGQQYIPYRRVLLLDRNGVDSSLKKFKEEKNNEMMIDQN